MKCRVLSFVIFFIILIPHIAQSQKPTGIFLTRKSQGHCTNKKELLNRREYFCLEEKSIVTSADFAAISDIYFETQKGKRNIDIILTPNGSKIVNAYASTFKFGELAVVVKGKLVSIVNIGGASNIKTITVWDRFDSKSVKWIHKNLMASVSKKE